MKYKLQKEPQEVYEMVIAQVTRARNYTDDVEWSSEDGTRTCLLYTSPSPRDVEDLVCRLLL